jgi:hypothetical protein
MNAYELQEVLRKTTKILAGEEIDVIMEGFQPRVEFDPKTKKPTRIVIPALPENTPEKLVQAIHGFIDHECSHIMFSDNEDICDSTKSQMWHYIHNCIEDPRVNKAMGEYYLGSAKNIKNGYSYLFNEPAADGAPNPYDKSYVDDLDLTDPKVLAEQQMRYSSLWFAHQMGDELSGHKFKDLDLNRVFGDLEAKMDKRWMDQLKRIRSANDVKNCTGYFESFFEKEALEKMQPKGGKGKSGSGSEKGKEEKGKAGGGGIGATEEVLKSLEDELGEKIKQHIEYGTLESECGIYWTDRWDEKLNKHKILKIARNSGAAVKGVQAFESDVQSVTNYLAKDLRRLLEERRRRYYIGGYKSGKLNTKALHSVKLGNDRVFKKRNEVRAINAAVSLLVDMSGSMSGDKIKIAMQSAYAFALVLDQVGVAYEIYGFCTQGRDSAMLAGYKDFADTIDPRTKAKIINQYCPETIYAFKEFHEPFDLISKQGLVATAGNGMAMIQNEDSKHVKMALERLSSRPERVKSLFVFSDGSPAFPSENPSVGHRTLKYFGHKAKEKYGVDIYSIGICSESVKSFYPLYKIVHSVPELPTALFEFLRKAI